MNLNGLFNYGKIFNSVIQNSGVNYTFNFRFNTSTVGCCLLVYITIYYYYFYLFFKKYTHLSFYRSNTLIPLIPATLTKISLSLALVNSSILFTLSSSSTFVLLFFNSLST